MFQENDPNTLYVEFSSSREVNKVFKHIGSLPRSCQVRRYILPSLSQRFIYLSGIGSEYRRVRKYQTKIIYLENNLCLLVKMPPENVWTVADSDPTPTILSNPDSIPQCDGLEDIDTPHANTSSNQPALLTTQAATPLPTGLAPYHLNHDKQAARVASDASRENMQITINNNDTDVNLQCSTGFFIVVAQPCLSSISKGSTKQYSNIQVFCSDFFKQVDQGGFLDFLRISFELFEPDHSLLGKVCVHMRNTTRLVQIQGSAKMPDKTTAAVWFAENVLVDKFTKLAKTKHYDIDAFNHEILEMSRKHHKSV